MYDCDNIQDSMSMKIMCSCCCPIVECIIMTAMSFVAYHHNILMQYLYTAQIRSDKKEKPLQEVKLLKAVVFTNPIEEAETILKQTIEQNMTKRINTVKTSVIGGQGSSLLENSSSSSSSTSMVVGQQIKGGYAENVSKIMRTQYWLIELAIVV